MKLSEVQARTPRRRCGVQSETVAILMAPLEWERAADLVAHSEQAWCTPTKHSERGRRGMFFTTPSTMTAPSPTTLRRECLFVMSDAITVVIVHDKWLTHTINTN